MAYEANILEIAIEMELESIVSLPLYRRPVKSACHFQARSTCISCIEAPRTACNASNTGELASLTFGKLLQSATFGQTLGLQLSNYNV